MASKIPGWQQARMDYDEWLDRHGLLTSWEEELLEQERQADRDFERTDWRRHELWGL